MIKSKTTMENESRIVELLAESLKKFDRLSEQMDGVLVRLDRIEGEMVGVKTEMVGVKGELITINGRLAKIDSEIIKLNLVSSENTLALIKLGDQHDRINRLEKAVFQ